MPRGGFRVGRTGRGRGARRLPLMRPGPFDKSDKFDNISDPLLKSLLRRREVFFKKTNVLTKSLSDLPPDFVEPEDPKQAAIFMNKRKNRALQFGSLSMLENRIVNESSDDVTELAIVGFTPGYSKLSKIVRDAAGDQKNFYCNYFYKNEIEERQKKKKVYFVTMDTDKIQPLLISKTWPKGTFVFDYKTYINKMNIKTDLDSPGFTGGPKAQKRLITRAEYLPLPYVPRKRSRVYSSSSFSD